MNKNRLANASSPYLRQHARNPVDWYAWSPEAFTIARREGKPILLSIGYAACHWCHVMAKESFEDEATAAQLNQSFVSIKVDREERPDLDQIYQAAHQLLTRQPGGWPLTIFLSPDQAPFFSGTYFPSEPRLGMPSFRQVLTRVSEAYAGRTADLRATGEAVRHALAQLAEHRGEGELPDAMVSAARAKFFAAFDLKHGGLGHAPKFPRVPELEFCLRAAVLAGDDKLREAVCFSLRRMAEGGLCDHLGGGFFRYCVDGFWEIPHFEKMLYDNALLLRLYADAFALDGDRVFREAAEGVVHWLQAEMRSAQGLFYSSLDADSEHEEGRYYVWAPEELHSALDAPSYALAAQHWGWEGSPNFEGCAWHLRSRQSAQTLAERSGKSPGEVLAALASIKHRLKALRDRRVRPGLDEKLLTAWNALTITGLTRAARVFGRSDWLALARQAYAALRQQAWCNGRLLATAQPTGERVTAYLDDYAFLLEASLELMETDFRQDDLDFALEVTGVLLAQFRGDDGGGFFFTAAEHETLLARMRTGFDQATPSGNGVLARALLRLGQLTGTRQYADAAQEILQALAPRQEEHFEGQGALLSAMLEWREPVTLAWLRGPRDEVASWLRALPLYRPGIVAIALSDQPGPGPAPRGPTPPCATAWVCREGVCAPPVVNLSGFLDVMGLSANAA